MRGKLPANLMHFARLLRAVGIPVGPGRVIDGLRAVQAVGVTRRSDFYWALHSVFVQSGEQRELFDQAFRAFWRETVASGQAAERLVATSRIRVASLPAPGSRRLAEAASANRPESPLAPERIAVGDVSYSNREALRHKDFEQMSVHELEEARRAVDRLDLPARERPTRRFRLDRRGGRVDVRATMRASVRSGGSGIPLRWKAPRRRPPPVVALCDISGSMGRYTRMFLRLLHALANRDRRTEVFLFGTRLSRATKQLEYRDIDEALAKLGASVEDWSGGTRIGECLRAFNRCWARRVLAQGAVVLLISDGLDRDEAKTLAKETERLRRSCRRLIWLNPLLRYEGFEPKALGIRAMLPFVDDFRPVHNLETLGDLVEALNDSHLVAKPPRPRLPSG